MNGELSRLDFILKLISQMIENNCTSERKSIKRNRPVFNPTRLSAAHYPAFVNRTEKNTKPKRRCAYCSKQNLRKETRYYCIQCGVGLCAAPCFGLYHSMVNL